MNKTLQQRLGFAATDRLLILHADDVGMCEATVSAWRELLDVGLLTSASAMAPCAWFPAVAEIAKAYGERADLGLHLTLTAEWPQYRWNPLTGTDPTSGLVDDAGYFHSLACDMHEQATPDAVWRELEAQIFRAENAGVTLTHFDSHMLALWYPTLMPLFVELAVKHQLPAFTVRHTAQQIADDCVIPIGLAEVVEAQLDVAAAAGHIMPIDSWHILPFGTHIDLPSRLKWACERLDTFGPGVHAIIGHPANDTPELRAIAADYATRIGDRQLFGSEQFRMEIQERGFKLIGLRQIRDLLRTEIAQGLAA